MEIIKTAKMCAWTALLLFAFAATSTAQSAAPQQPSQGPVQTTPKGEANGAQANQKASDAEKKDSEQRLSPAEAAELFKSVDEILQFVSKDTGLPIKTPVKRELASRETVEKYISEQAEQDEDRPGVVCL